MSNIRNKVKLGILAAAVVFMAVLISSIHETVPVGEEAAVSSWGKVNMGEVVTGSSFKAPWSTYDYYNLQSRTYSLKGVGIAAQDKFKNSMNIDYTGRFLPGFAAKIRSSTGTANRFLNTHVHKSILSCTVKAGVTIATSQDFYQETVQRDMADYVQSCITEYLNSENVGGGYEITKVQFSDVILDSRVEKFMVQTKARLEAEEQQISDARISASKANEIVAKSNSLALAAAHKATERRLLADARFYEIRKESEGNILLSKSVTKELSDYIRAQKWDGKYPGVMTGGSTELQLQLK